MSDPKPRDIRALPGMIAELDRIEQTAHALARFQGTLRRARPGRTVQVDYDEVHALLLCAEADLNQAATTIRDGLERYYGSAESLEAALRLRERMQSLDAHFRASLNDVAHVLDAAGLM